MTGPETDLERIEAALATGQATADDPRERELQELALALRADSPEPAPAFASELDERVRAGFAKPRRAGASAARLRRVWIPSLAAATALIAVAVVGIASLGGGDEVTEPQTAVLEKPASGGAGDFNLLGPQRDAAAGAPAAAGGRRVERSVELTIATAKDKLQEAADGVGTVAESHGGFVLSSHVNTGDEGSGGTFTLRVPQRQLQATVADISKLGHLKARSESGLDMTAPFNKVQDKLGNALVERHTLRIRLRHTTGAEADDLRARIAALNAAIDTLNGRMHDLERRTSYSTVNVTLQEEHSDGAGGTGAAWDDARRTLEGMLNFGVRLLGVLLPLALLAALGALGARTFRRRRREAPLL